MFMSSGHWTNSGMAKFINDNLYNYKSDDEKSMNPFRWYRLQNGEDVSKYRETINGFPCRLILINDGNTPLNEGQNEPTPGNTKDMGIFNFNHDKDATKTLGFDNDIFPNCASYEVTANSDTSAGAFMSYEHKNVWDGTWIKNYPSNTNYLYSSGAFAILFEVKPNVEYVVKKIGGNYFQMSMYPTIPQINVANGKNIIMDSSSSLTEYTFIGQEGYPYVGLLAHYDNNFSGNINNLVTLSVIENNKAEELAYLKESFELRHPDADDVAEDWGFMGVESDTLVIDMTNNGTARMSVEYFGTREFTFENRGDLHLRRFKEDGTSTLVYNVTTTTIGEDIIYIQLYGGNLKTYSTININGVEYYLNKDTMTNSSETQKDPYVGKSFNTSYGLKTLIDWVDNCTDEEFVRDFEQHFHKDYTLRYFCLVTLIGAVDNLGKNMMLDTADNKIYFPRFYDIDTICSYDNSGQLKFDVDIEMEQGYWNTSSSRLWTRIRDLMHNDIVTTYNNMRQNGVSYENMMHYIYDEQIAKIPQTYYNKD